MGADMRIVAGSPLSSQMSEIAVRPVAGLRLDLSSAKGVRALGILLLLALIYGVAYLGRVPVPGLYRDDWSHLQLALAGESWRTLFYTWPTDYRPFESLPWFAWTGLFGANVARYYDTLFAICYLNGILLYVCLARLTTSRSLALAATVLWTMFPADGSVFWLSAIAYRVGMLFFLIALLVLVTPLHASLAWRWVALAGAALSLASNEIFLGLVAALALVAARGAAGDRWRQVRPYLTVAALYLVYRLIVGPHLLAMFDNHQGDFDPSPLQAVSIAILGSYTIVLGGWVSALGAVFGGSSGVPPWEPTDESFFFGVPTHYAPLPAVAAVVVVAALLGGSALVWRSRDRWLPRLARACRRPASRPGLLAVAMGAIGITAGIAPLLLTGHQPTLTGVDARVNAAATPGAALFLAGLLWLTIATLPLRRARAGGLFALAVALLALLALGNSNRVADNYTRAWDTQRQIWDRLLTVAPGFKPGTVLLLAGADPASGKAVLQLTPWGMQSALDLIYGPDIQGTSMPFWQQPPACAARRYPGAITQYTFAADRSYLWGDGQLILPDPRVVVLRYNSSGSGSITVVHGTYQIAGPGCTVTSNPAQIVATPSMPNRWRIMISQAK
jgi:hypothetical protein